MSQHTIITEINHSVQSSKGLFVAREVKYYVLPKLKFVRSKDKKVVVSKRVILEKAIDVPFEIVLKRRTRSWLGNGFQSDDVNCYEEWMEEVKVYDDQLIKDFIDSTVEGLVSSYAYPVEVVRNKYSAV